MSPIAGHVSVSDAGCATIRRMSEPRKPRRSAGTRTGFDVLRNLFRPPTDAQKATDLAEVRAGRELLVACRLPLPPGRKTGLIPQGKLHVFDDRVVCRVRNHPEVTFRRGEWTVTTTPRGRAYNQFGYVHLVSESDNALRYELRVPNPDLDLVRTVLAAV